MSDVRQPSTADEMKEAITIMMLNRIDELQGEMDAADQAGLSDEQSRKWNDAFTRKREAQYIIATCLDRFQPRRAAIAEQTT